MQQDELTAAYMTVLNESNESEVKGSTLKSGSEAFGDFKKGNDAEENVDLDKPANDKELSANVKEGEPKKLKESKGFKNPFDELYNKIVSENSFGFSTEDENTIEPADDFGLDTPSDNEGENLDDSGIEDELEGLEGEEEGEEVDLGVLVSTLKDVLSQLEKIVGVEGDEEEEIDDIEDLSDEGDESDEIDGEFGEESEDDEEGAGENPFKEGYDRKKGDKAKAKDKSKKSSLKGKFKKFEKGRGNDVAEEAVKVTGLKKGINLTPFKGNIKPLQSKKAEVSSNIKTSKGSAQVPSTGKGHDGVPSKLSLSGGQGLAKASSHTVSGAVKPGKPLFEQ